MSVILPLDSRQARITRLLLADRKPATLDAIATQLKLTTRIVRYNLPPVESYLRSAGLEVVRRRGVGIWVSGDDAHRRQTLTSLDPTTAPRVLAAEDRKLHALITLLDASPEAVELGDLGAELGASRPTVRRDVRATETWLEEHHLHLQRLPGVGVVVRGSEIEIRKGLLALILESVPAEALTDAMRRRDGDAAAPEETPGATIEEFVGRLDLATYRGILRDELHDRDDNGPMAMVETLFVAIVARRVRRGHHAAFQSGQLRSLIDHPVADAAARISAAVGSAADLVLTDADVASITEFILGFVELVEATVPAEPTDGTLIERLVALAAERLHPSLAEDDQLRLHAALAAAYDNLGIYPLALGHGQSRHRRDTLDGPQSAPHRHDHRNPDRGRCHHRGGIAVRSMLEHAHHAPGGAVPPGALLCRQEARPCRLERPSEQHT